MSGQRNKLKPLFWIGGLALAFLLGFVLRGGGDPATPGQTSEQTVTEWTCAMHPQVRLPEQTPCPICGMDLVPLDMGTDAASADLMAISPQMAERAKVRTDTVRRESIEIDVPMVGKIDIDETRIREITAYVPGRIERMYVDYTGVEVKRGDHLVRVYSPDLVAAQEELIQAVRSVERLEGNPLESLSQTAHRTVIAAREKLRLMGLDENQIERLETSQERQDEITFYSPISGVVLTKHQNQGSYVQTGSKLYTIAALDRLWVRLDAFESDLEWLRLGQAVTFEADALPGETFEGRITFIDPLVDPATRTTHVRLNIKNKTGRLKPGMLVRAKAKGKAATGHQIFDPYLANKWISPMHPEVVKEGPGSCDVCGMALVPASELGYAASEKSALHPLTIPASAPLITGDRAIVYVEKEVGDQVMYESREIELGPRAGDRYIVTAGLREDERVVVEGAFRLDAAMQIQAKPSMMSATSQGANAPSSKTQSELSRTSSAEQDITPSVSANETAKVTEAWLEPYLNLQEALAADDLQAAKAALAQWPSQDFMPIKKMQSATTLEEMRASLEALSEVILAAAIDWDSAQQTQVAFCPMAGADGARWLQRDGELANPYYGASMLRCGVLRGPPGEASRNP